MLLLLLPDFLLIVCGYLICRHTALDRPVWDAPRRLVYYLLFPVLLFTSIVRNPLRPAELLSLAAAGWRWWLPACLAYARCAAGRGWTRGCTPRGAQTAFRFNSYVALALAERLAGTQGWPGSRC
jgi:malonate transporter